MEYVLTGRTADAAASAGIETRTTSVTSNRMSEPPAKDNPAAVWRAASVVALWKLMALGLLVTLFWDAPWVSHLVQDIRTWRAFFLSTQAGLVPYVDITKEYPVLGGALYWAMSPFVVADDLRQTVVVHGLFMLAADVLNTVLFYRLARGILPALALPATLLFALNLTSLVTGPVRYEPWVTTFVLLGLAAHRRGRYDRATFWWAIGCGLKWYPAFFVAAQEYRLWRVDGRRTHWIRAALVFAAATAVVNVPFLVAAWREGTVDNWLAPYLFHARRPLYWDTLLGVGQIWLGPLPWERHAGLWSLGLMVAAIVFRPSMPLEGKGVLICLAAVFFNRIYSTQFNLWFYPLLILAALGADEARRRTLLFLMVLLDFLNVMVFPTTFTPAVAEMGGFFPFAARDGGGPWTVAFSWVIVARALVVLALAIAIARGAGGRVDAPP
jgi:hypothetical protein